MEVTGCWIKKHKCKKTLEIFSSENKGFYNFHKIPKSTLLNTMAVYL